MSAPHPFVLFVSSVEGYAVTRYGSGTPSRRATLIGAQRVPGRGIVWDTREVVALTEDELRQYSKEYRGAIADKALRQRTEADWKAWIASQQRSQPTPEAPPENETETSAAPPQE